MTDIPFGRQPMPVKIIFMGETVDVEYWMAHVKRACGFKGDLVEQKGINELKIYPRAVND